MRKIVTLVALAFGMLFTATAAPPPDVGKQVQIECNIEFPCAGAELTVTIPISVDEVNFTPQVVALINTQNAAVLTSAYVPEAERGAVDVTTLSSQVATKSLLSAKSAKEVRGQLWPQHDYWCNFL